ncbi:MAG: glycosyltransferase family 4 protein [Candidatus Magasanikbacteria bacterium]|nr:glycosyltransferase family 4 protein [Candidatus Magasanikbacteria bacterium]
MNIAIDLRCLLNPCRTGVGEYTVGLLEAIFARDQVNEYYLLINAWGRLPALPRWEQKNVRWVKTRWPNKLFNAAELLCRRPRLDQFIIRHSDFSLRQLDIFFSPHLNFTALSPGVKHILTIHDLTGELFPAWFTARQRRWHYLVKPRQQSERADLILVPSENTKRDVVEYYQIPAAKVRVLYPGGGEVQGEREKEKGGQILKKYSLPEKFILFLGTIEPRKNITALIKAFEQSQSAASDKLPATSLVIAGAPGWKNQAVYARARRSPYRDRIRFLGYVSAEEKTALYRAADLFVYPSLYEGFGFPVLEAMAASCPVITSPRGSLPEISGTAAYLANPHRPAEIAAGIRLLLTDPNRRATAIQQGLTQAKKFTWRQAAAQWLEIIQSL